ncbi:MAG: phosphoenolpyruvate--protein phosphotransferase [Candidatus Latescibacteria bacterium]|nr:phosphoenolpyruvate--protein phosphotransferase [Candidatus Latescibacterota bacterium]
MLKGIPASPGIAIGKAFTHNQGDVWFNWRHLSEAEVEPEVDRFLEALQEVGVDVERVRRQVEARLGKEHAQIFDAHLLMLRDPMLADATVSMIRKDRTNAEYAFYQTLREVKHQFDAIEDEYYRARVSDLLDVESRVLAKLCGEDRASLANLDMEAVVVAHTLTPSDTAHMSRDRVLGFVTEAGGSTSHVAIIARGLGIPAVVGVETATTRIEPGDLVVVDGTRGVVHINPDAEALAQYRAEAERLKQLERTLPTLTEFLAETTDGVRVELAANVDLPEEVEMVLRYGAEGIGLYRTEFLYLTRPALPTEEEQAEAYRWIAERVAPQPVVIRTLDLGGDKLSHVFHAQPEMNPFLGWRAIRVCLAHRDIFRTQLRAILRASACGNVRIMFPMISGLEEVVEAKQVLEEARSELRAQGIPFDEECQVGVMIEVPSAAMVADQIAEEVQFFSIGTNDLVQYAVAVDRSNERVAYLFDALHPGVLRLIKGTIEAGHHRGIPVGMCGEMCGEPLSAILLLGLGLNSFSMSPSAIPEIKRMIRSISLSDARSIASEAMSCKTPAQVRAYLQRALQGILQDAEADEAGERGPHAG